jgi:hypothetical protein
LIELASKYLFMPPLSLQIGNGDDKLTQAEGHEFVVMIKKLVGQSCSKLQDEKVESV